jgi:hypothetical protein
VFLEAIACGLPVIASTADASVEVIDHGRLGVAVDPSDSTALANAIRRAVLNPTPVASSELLQYSYERFRERWRALLMDVLAEPGLPGTAASLAKESGSPDGDEEASGSGNCEASAGATGGV